MRLIEFKEAYAKLVNMLYGELNDEQKRTVYAMEIYHDSQDALTACDIYAPQNPREAIPTEFIDEQLRNTFQYEDVTVVTSK